MSRSKSTFTIQLLNSLRVPLFLLLLMWSVKLIETFGQIDFAFLGILPRNVKGLIGIFTSPFIHGDWKHLWSNSISFLMLSWAIFFFYQKIAFRTLLLIALLTGIWVWVSARTSYHIGASGIIYGMASFLFLAGILGKNRRLAALSLLISLFYGGMIWGVLPGEERISWESHLSGALAGIVVAFYLRNDLMKIEDIVLLIDDSQLNISDPKEDLIGDDWKIDPYDHQGKISFKEPPAQPFNYIYKPNEKSEN